MDPILEKYKLHLQKLNVSHREGVKAPHKAILLLSVMRLIESGELSTNHVFYSDLLKNTFRATWAEFIGESPLFNPDVAMPFWHLKNEKGLWKLKLKNHLPSALEVLASSSPKKYIVQFVEYAEIPEDFFTLLKDCKSRAVLSEVLFEKYIYI